MALAWTIDLERPSHSKQLVRLFDFVLYLFIICTGGLVTKWTCSIESVWTAYSLDVVVQGGELTIPCQLTTIRCGTKC